VGTQTTGDEDTDKGGMKKYKLSHIFIFLKPLSCKTII
jgi:hypothetical protein